MERLVKCFTTLCLLITSIVAQDWHPEVVLVSTGSPSEEPDIAVVGENVHIIWEDLREWPAGDIQGSY